MGSPSSPEAQEAFLLKWNDFHLNLAATFADLRKAEDLFDVQLICDDGKLLGAHKIILSAYSSVLKRLVRTTKVRSGNKRT